MKAHQAEYPVRRMCRLLGVSPSGYYGWLARPLSVRQTADWELTETIRRIHSRSTGTYGAPRIHAELADDHRIRVGRKRVARLMRQAGLRGISRRKFRVGVTLRDPRARPAPDLVERCFVAERPDQLWVADIKQIPTWEGKLYVASVLDVFSRRAVGWSMAPHMRTGLVLAAIEMAISQRHPHGVIHHSDQGSQYTAIAYGTRCAKAGIIPSMGSVGDCYDNALAESFFATIECELLDRHTWRTRTQAAQAIFEYIEGWYNPQRRHSALGYLSPINYERRHLAEST